MWVDNRKSSRSPADDFTRSWASRVVT